MIRNRLKPLSIATYLCAFIMAMSPAFATENLTIRAVPIDFSAIHPSQIKYGELYWRGGLVLKSSNRDFGGFSGVELSADGKNLLAISDRGYWLKAKLNYKNGKPDSLTNAQMAPMLNANGKKYKHWEIDSEGLTKRNNSLSDVVVSSERSQALYRYKLGNSQLNASAMDWGAISQAKKIQRNLGLESVTSLPKSHKYRGWLLAIAERKLDKNGNHSAWLINGKQDHGLNIKRYGGFDITDAAYLPNGDIVILERAISLFSGPQMQIRQICGRDVKPNALIDGKKLLSINWVVAVDNMEGLGVHKASNGETILTIMSDNNFHFLQRNLLLQFALVDDKSVCK